MKHVSALIIKFIISSVLLIMLALFDTVDITEILLMSLILTAVGYVIGDMIVLPRYGNLTACITDFFVYFGGIWVLTQIMVEGVYPFILFAGFTAFFIALSESLFHLYMENRVFPDNGGDDKDQFSSGRYQTEFAEEKDVDRSRKDKKKEE